VNGKISATIGQGVIRCTVDVHGPTIRDLMIMFYPFILEKIPALDDGVLQK
jgi:hypothetical protein